VGFAAIVNNDIVHNGVTIANYSITVFTKGYFNELEPIVSSQPFSAAPLVPPDCPVGIGRVYYCCALSACHFHTYDGWGSDANPRAG
jgi:hypothetical protein